MNNKPIIFLIGMLYSQCWVLIGSGTPDKVDVNSIAMRDIIELLKCDSENEQDSGTVRRIDPATQGVPVSSTQQEKVPINLTLNNRSVRVMWEANIVGFFFHHKKKDRKPIPQEFRDKTSSQIAVEIFVKLEQQQVKIDEDETNQCCIPLEQQCTRIESIFIKTDEVGELKALLEDAQNYEYIIKALENIAPSSTKDRLDTIKDHTIKLAGKLTQKIKVQQLLTSSEQPTPEQAKPPKPTFNELKEVVENNVKNFSILTKTIGMLAIMYQALPWYKKIISALIPGYYPAMEHADLDKLELMNSLKTSDKNNLSSCDAWQQWRLKILPYYCASMTTEEFKKFDALDAVSLNTTKDIYYKGLQTSLAANSKTIINSLFWVPTTFALVHFLAKKVSLAKTRWIAPVGALSCIGLEIVSMAIINRYAGQHQFEKLCR